jgi:hypothetical protein
MDWITDKIAIGNFLEAQDETLLREMGIRSALSLDGTLDPSDAGFSVLREIVVVKLVDGPGNDVGSFRRAVAAVADLVEREPPLLVQCHAGRSRSAIVVAGYLVGALGIEPSEAINLVASKRAIYVSSGMQELLDHLP